MGLKLGLLATARISAKLLAGAADVEEVSVVAVGGRDPARADAFAREHGIPRALGSYEALLADDEVEAVYIALPNALHAEWATRALEAGKHVLVEKPFTTDADVAARCFDLAEERGLVLTEGFMWRHHPQAAGLTALVNGGEIGELRLVRASFSFTLASTADVRADPALGGGSLLDVGTYCVSGARLLAGEPSAVEAFAVRPPGGVDMRFAGLLRHESVLTVFDCGFDLPARSCLEAVGSEATVRLLDPWHGVDPVLELVRGDEVERRTLPRANPYGRELADFAAAIRDRRPPLLGRDWSVGQARALRMLIEAAG